MEINKLKSLTVKDMFRHYYISFLNKNDNYVLRDNKIYLSTNKELYICTKQVVSIKNNIKELSSKEILTSPEKLELSNLKIELKRKVRKEAELKSEDNKEIFIIDFATFSNVINLFNTKATEEIINGNVLELPKNLGHIFCQRIERNHANKSVNWNATNKLRDEHGVLPINTNGKPKMIYYTEDEWLKINWRRGNSSIDNIASYKFVPADGQVGKGFKNIFVDRNNSNPALRLNYEFIPFVHKDNVSNIKVYWKEKDITLSIKKASDIIRKEFNDKRQEGTIMTYIVKCCKGAKIKGFPFNFKFHLNDI